MDFLSECSTSIESEVLKSPTITIFLLSVLSKFASYSVLYIQMLLHAYIFIIVMSSWSVDPLTIIWCLSLSLVTVFDYKSLLSAINTVTLALLATICIKYLFHPFTFSLYMIWNLNWVSCRQHTVGSCWLFKNPFSYSMYFDRGV